MTTQNALGSHVIFPSLLTLFGVSLYDDTDAFRDQNGWKNTKVHSVTHKPEVHGNKTRSYTTSAQPDLGLSYHELNVVVIAKCLTLGLTVQSCMHDSVI